MEKIYTALGLMSGTSMDGIDASVINSDGTSHYEVIYNKYFEYNGDLYQKLTKLRDKINSSKDIKILSNELKTLEREITLFHAEIVNKILKEVSVNIDFVGFHGQTIFHNAVEKISMQLGDGNLLSQLTKKIIIYDFRQNDLLNGGQGAPLTPIFHNIMVSNINKEFQIGYPISILNIGGISNITHIKEPKQSYGGFFADDIGPGNCLIDEWIRKSSNKKYDENGFVAKSGKTNKLILDQALENFNFKSLEKYEKNIKKNNLILKDSLDTKDFDISFVRGLSLEDGAATLTEYTATIIAQGLCRVISGHPSSTKVLVCGGGRKNKYLMQSITKKRIEILKTDDYVFNEHLDAIKEMSLESIDKYHIDGDFVESQAFAYLAIRSYLKLPISFTFTTGCKEEFGCTGGVLVKNY
ncbi:anhydro-N-acetylmuramic acid kinase [Candidatus Pelagibacter sp.]|nr:anhydro-N-acetylmuramic acid kinase [Candidatus Pelagibacter sp.]